MIGKILSHYRIIDEIGAGGMGVVYKAEDTKLKRTVALKFLPERSVSSEKDLMRFTREAQAAAALDHPNICAVHEIEEAEGKTFISMAFCEGKNLYDLIRERSLILEDSLSIATQVAEGLSAAHSKGIIHRDVKPANIMIDESMRVKITDFGLAKLSDRTGLTRTGAAVGTASYMSPEQIRGEETDARSDIWSLGVVLYELVTGEHPFEGEYDAAVLYSILNLDPPPSDKVNASIPPDLAALIGHALEKRTEDRYQSMDEMLEDLHTVQHLLTHTAEPSEHVKRYGRRKRMIRATFITSSILVAVVMIYVILSGLISREDIEPISVMVVDVDNRTNNPEFDDLTDLLIADLDQSRYIDVMSRERLNDLRRQLEAQTLDESTAYLLASVDTVQTVLFSTVNKVGDVYWITASIHDPARKESLFTKSVKGSGISALIDMLDELYTMINMEFQNLDIIPSRGSPEQESLSDILTTPSIEAYTNYKRGKDLYESGNQLEALQYLERAVEIDPDYINALRGLAMLYDYNGDEEKALSFASRAIELSKDKGEREYINSMITEHLVMKNWDRAIELMRGLLEENPDDMAIRHQLGFYLAKYKKSYGEAIEQYKKAFALDPKNLKGRFASLYNHLGNAYLFSGNVDQAIEVLEKYKKYAPGAPDPLHSMAYALMYSGQYDQATRLYQEIIDDHPSFYIAYEDIGSTHLACGRWRNALSSFERYLEKAPPTARARGWAHIAYVHDIQGNIAKAEDAIERALELDPYCPEARRLQGLIALRDHKDQKTALLALEAISRKEVPTSYTLAAASYQNLNGWIQIESGDHEAGIRCIQQAIKLTPNKYICFEIDLVRAYIAIEDFEKAIDRGNRLLGSNPNDGELLLMLSEAHEAAGESRIAEQYSNRARDAWKNGDPDFCPLEKIASKSSEHI